MEQEKAHHAGAEQKRMWCSAFSKKMNHFPTLTLPTIPSIAPNEHLSLDSSFPGMTVIDGALKGHSVHPFALR